MASSAVSAFQRVQQKRAASQDRSKSKERGAAPAPSPNKDAEKSKAPAQAPNDPFEKYFVKSEATGRASSSYTNSSTLPRYSRPF